MPPLRSRADAFLAVAGLTGLLVFVALYQQAYPHAAVKLSLSYSEALARARTVAESLGAPVGRLQQAVQFRGNTVELLFLQRSLGLQEASRWASEEVPIWYWDARWFRPLQKEEWQVSLGVDGKLVRLDHLIEETAPGDSLSLDSARVLVESFIRNLGWKLEELNLVESSSQKRERRIDHRFTWEQHGSTISPRGEAGSEGTGAVRLSVSVLGGEVGSYRHFLKVPEDFERQLKGTLVVGSVIALGTLIVTVILILIALALCITRAKSSLMQWRAPLTLAAVTAVLGLIDGLTSWPSFKYGYQTEFPWGAYLGLGIVGLLFVALVYGGAVTLTAAAGESLGRELFPRSVRGLTELARGRFLTPELSTSILRGYALGFGLLGYLTLFYVAAQRWLGAWLPAEGPYSDIFNRYLPFLAPLAVGVIAGITEEITYRLFGVSLVKRYLKSIWLALLIPAAIWAFAHSNYPVFPVYVRGVELTVAGVLLGVALLRYGVVACIVAHFAINAVLTGVPLLTSGHTGYLFSGVIVMAGLLIPALLGWIPRRRASL